MLYENYSTHNIAAGTRIHQWLSVHISCKCSAYPGHDYKFIPCHLKCYLKFKELGISTYNYLFTKRQFSVNLRQLRKLSGRADSPQLSRLHSVAMTPQDRSAFSLVWFHARGKLSAKRLPKRKMHCCCQISITKNHIVFDAKITRLNQKKNCIYICNCNCIF